MTEQKKKHTKVWVALAAALAAATATVVLALYFFLPSGYLGIDVNPSVEIHTNRLGKVTSVEPANPDAAQLLYGYRVTDNDLDDVVEDLVDLMIIKGYITATGPNDVLITVGNDTVSQDVLNKVNERIASYLETRRFSANVMQQQVKLNNQLQEEASAAGMSADLALSERVGQIETEVPKHALRTEVDAQITAANSASWVRKVQNTSLPSQCRVGSLAGRWPKWSDCSPKRASTCPTAVKSA